MAMPQVILYIYSPGMFAVHSLVWLHDLRYRKNYVNGDSISLGHPHPPTIPLFCAPAAALRDPNHIFAAVRYTTTTVQSPGQIPRHNGFYSSSRADSR